MKLVVTSENLVAAIRRVIPAINSKPTNPIMANLLFVADGEKLTVTAADFDVRISTCIPALVTDPGKITLPAKKIQQIAGALPSGDVELSQDEDNSPEVSLTCRKSYYKVRGLDAEDFPADDDIVYDWGFNMPVKELFSAFSKVIYARAEDESRKELNGLLLSIRGGMLTIAATDGRRLAMVEKPFQEEMQEEHEGDVILAYKSVMELMKSLDPADQVKISLNQSAASFETPTTTINTKLREGRYPNFRSVIPPSFAQTVAISRLSFIDVLTRVSMVASDANPQMCFEFFNNEVVISARSNEYGESHESLEVSMDGNPITVCFNPNYLTEPLKYLDCDQLFIKFNDVLNPVSLEGDEGFIYILMPMKLPEGFVSAKA
jgi:DNA polymerase-3 subunit beta